ncbi:MAG: ABC transporter permease [Clostridiales bacterium]|jgi:peptide/nickel transport system permease protein|nr:ABC transporter permease [Clostridiales bacterium]
MFKSLGKSLLRQGSGTIGGFIVILFVLIAVFAPLIATHDPNEMFLVDRLKPPLTHSDTGLHFMGFDSLGRDVFSRVVYGARISLYVGVVATVISLVIGCTLGLLAGYYRGAVDMIIMRLVDIQLAFPFMLLALTIMATLGAGTTQIILVMGVFEWMRYARIVRGETLSLREMEFVEAAKASGTRNALIMFRHILPNIVAPVVVVTTFNVASNILAEASLSFLGLGVDAGTPSWGSMLSESRDFLQEAWWVATFPGIATMLSVLGINLLGDWLRDFLDPKIK